MLTGRDDFIGHQIPTTFDHVVTSDPMWTERMWFTLHDVTTGNVLFDCGLGHYPNKNVQDAFAGIALDGKQYNVRMSRALRPDAGRVQVGPLSFHVLEGLRRHRLLLEKNESGLSFDIEWEAGFNPHEEEHHYRRRTGKVVEDLSRYSQLGRARGTVTLPTGRGITLDPHKWCGQRDHSWGVRPELRTEEGDPNKTHLPSYFYNWITAQFPTFGLHCFFNERAPGNFIYLTGEVVKPIGQDADDGLRVTAVEHDWAWAPHPASQTLEKGEVRFRLANGDTKTAQIRTLPARYFLRSGMYGAWRGWYHGDNKGRYYWEHDVWDLTDNEFMKRVGTFSDQLIEVRMDGEVGHGIIEYGVTRGFPKYQEVQHLPAF